MSRLGECQLGAVFDFRTYTSLFMKSRSLKKVHPWTHGIINYIDNKPKCHHLKNQPIKGLCGSSLSEAPPSLVFICRF
jgi:hypothetical protein